MQRQWHGVAPLVLELHSGGVGTDHGAAIGCIVISGRQIGAVEAIGTLVRSEIARRQSIPTLHLVHFVVDVVVIVAQAVVATEAGE